MATYSGDYVQNTYSGSTRKWRAQMTAGTATSTDTTYTIPLSALKMDLSGGSDTTMKCSAGHTHYYLWQDYDNNSTTTGTVIASKTSSYPSSDKTVNASDDWTMLSSKSVTFKRTTVAYTGRIRWRVQQVSPSVWKGASTASYSFTVPALPSHTITADAGGGTIASTTGWTGTGTTATKSVQHNSTLDTLPTVSKTGYHLRVWTYPGGSQVGPVTVTTSTVITSALTITAQWTGNDYSVAFNANGGSGSMDKQTGFVYGTAKALNANSFTAPSGGYSFAGWATSEANAKAGTIAYTNQGNMITGTTTNNGTATLYAVWKRTITFKHGKANASGKIAVQYYGGNVTPPSITEVSGWTALGWRDDTSAGAKEYGANNTTAFAYTGTVTTLYAAYSRTLTISYAANNGSGTTPNNTTTTQYYNANGAITSPAVTLATNPYSQSGCTFAHWLVSTSNTSVASGGSYTWSIAVDATTTSRTATAQWNITVTISNNSYIYNGSAHSASVSVSIAGTTVEYGTSTSYGYSLTATNANTNYTMSSVSATNVADSKTIYYRVSKSGYITKTGSTTIKIYGVPVHSKINGTWKHGAVYVKISGAWKPATAGYVKVSGAWKSINK